VNPPPISRRIGLAIRIALLATSLLVALLGAEVGLRLLAPQTVRYWTPRNPYESDGAGAYRFRPGYRGVLANRTEFETTVRINKAGLRGEEIAPGHEDGCRILALGDSFTFGMGVEGAESYIAQLDSELNTSGHPVQGLNGGTPGLGMPQEVRWLERHPDLAPDLVLLAIFVGNDLQDATREWGTWEVVGGRATPSGTYARLRDWLYFHSHLYVLLKSHLPPGVQRPVRALLGWDEPWTVRSARAGFGIYAKQGSDLMTEAVDATSTALDRLLALSQERSFTLAAMLIPDEAQVDPELWRSSLAALGLDESALDPEEPNRVLGRMLAERGLPTLDLLEPIRRGYRDGQRLYFPEDRHWNAEGHRLGARELAAFLERNGLICPES
jgi:SGNH hydrolase-like domain, acetyltransferase AlgX